MIEGISATNRKDLVCSVLFLKSNYDMVGISVFYKRCPVYKNGVETGQYVYIAYWVETFKKKDKKRGTADNMTGGFPLYRQVHMSAGVSDRVRFSNRQQLHEKVN